MDIVSNVFGTGDVRRWRKPRFTQVYLESPNLFE